MAVETSLEYELTSFSLSLFSNKDQKMYKANKAGFSNTSLKGLTNPLDLRDKPCSSIGVDDGLLLYMVKCEQGHTSQAIADSYLSYVQYLGRHSQNITVVFDGYNSSPKYHDHISRTKNSCCDMQIRLDMINLTPRAKFLNNIHNKSELINILSSTFHKHQITVEQCDNDADTTTVKVALVAATDNSVEAIFILFVGAFLGSERRCRCAGNAGTSLPKYQPLTLFNYLKGLLQCQTNSRSSLRKTKALPAVLSCLYWL